MEENKIKKSKAGKTREAGQSEKMKNCKAQIIDEH